VQENTQTKYNSKKHTTQNTAKQNYSGSVTVTTLGQKTRFWLFLQWSQAHMVSYGWNLALCRHNV